MKIQTILSCISLVSTVALASASTTAFAQTTAPVKGDWTIDLSHTGINFSVRHMVVSTVHGRFNKVSGAIHAAGKDIENSTVDFIIQVASIDTNEPQRDAHLKSTDFFDATKYPTITYKSHSISKVGVGKYVAHGDFTLHGITKKVDLPFTLSGPVKDAFGQIRLGLQSNLRINRQDYGVKWNMKLDRGGLAVSDDVDIEINLEATPAK